MIYYAYFDQGQGCDYTIGCGKVLKKLNASNMADAENEVKLMLEENYYPGSESEVLKVTIIESVASINLNVDEMYGDILSERKRQEDEEIKRKELIELERLKSKYESKQ